MSDKRHPLTKPQDLVGQRIGIPSEGGTSETTLDLYRSSNSGIDPKKVQRQVTGFTPGHLRAHQAQGRIAGFIIGGSQEQQFREAQPTSVFLETADYVQDGLTYITSADGVKSNKAQIEAYMRALKGGCCRSSTTAPVHGHDQEAAREVRLPRAQERHGRQVLPGVQHRVNWMLDGRDKLLKVDKPRSGRPPMTQP